MLCNLVVYCYICFQQRALIIIHQSLNLSALEKWIVLILLKQPSCIFQIGFRLQMNEESDTIF